MAFITKLSQAGSKGFLDIDWNDSIKTSALPSDLEESSPLFSNRKLFLEFQIDHRITANPNSFLS